MFTLKNYINSAGFDCNHWRVRHYRNPPAVGEMQDVVSDEDIPCLSLVHVSVYQNVLVRVRNIIKCLKI